MGKSVEELKDALAEIQATMRSKCLSAFGYDEAKTERLIDEFAEMSRRLDDEEIGDLERLAAEQIITCWIQTTVTGYRLECLSPGQEGGRLAVFLEHRHNMAHNRLSRSMDQLARLRQSKATIGGTDVGQNGKSKHQLIELIRGENRDKIFCVKAHVCTPGGPVETSTVICRGNGWIHGIDDVDRHWDSETNGWVIDRYWGALPTRQEGD